MPALIFNIRHQRINRVDCFLPVRYSKNYLYTEFNFLTQDWEGVPKTAVFKSQKYFIPVVLGESDTCLVPHEVLEETKFSVSVFGGNLITVDSEEVKVFESGYRSDLVEPPTPDVYTQILTSLNGKADDLRYENNILYLMANKNTIASVKIVAGSGGSGTDGREVELRNNGEYIQWRYSGEEDWTNLVALADLKGEKGDNYILTEEDIEEIASKVKVATSADKITYDDTETKLGATNVQDAIGKVSEQKVDNPSTAEVGQVLKVKSVDENGKPTEWECVDDVQPDWKQNDETAPDYIKNRPFWNKNGERYSIINNTEIEFEDWGCDNAYVAWVELPYIEGVYTYRDIVLTIDDVQYKGMGNSWLCNESEEDNGEAFALYFMNYEDEAGVEIYIKKEFGEAHIVSLEYSIEPIVQIPVEYLPPVFTRLYDENSNFIGEVRDIKVENDQYNWGLLYDGYNLTVNVPYKAEYSKPIFKIKHYDQIDIPEEIGQTLTISRDNWAAISSIVFINYLNSNDFLIDLSMSPNGDNYRMLMSHKWVNSKIHANGLYVDDTNRCAIVSFVQTTDPDPNESYVFDYEIRVTRIF